MPTDRRYSLPLRAPANVQGFGVDMSYANSMFWFKCAARGGFERAGEMVGMVTAEVNQRCPLFGKRVVSIYIKF